MCCSNLRQGNSFQASLSGAGVALSLGAFLFAILLDPLSSIQQCLRQHIQSITSGIGFLDNPSLPLHQVGTLSLYRPAMRAATEFLRSDSLFCAPCRLVLSTEQLASEYEDASSHLREISAVSPRSVAPFGQAVKPA
jgi:hypothetical protein